MINQDSVSSVEIFDALGRGATVITANTRLAGVTQLDFEAAQMGKGLTSWPSPDVLSWAAWLKRSREQALVSGAIPSHELFLSPQQERWIWEEIITQSLTALPLQQITGTARAAQEAWQMMQSWQLPLSQTVFSYNIDSETFFQWASRFEEKCAARAWLPPARLPDALQPGLQSGTFLVSAELVFIGFDELTPQQQSLLKTLLATGCDVRLMRVRDKEPRAVRLGCADMRQETETLARWVRQRLEAHPEASIGVVVPELASQRNIVIHALDEVLVPQAPYPGRHALPRPYNISMGRPLSAYPVIRTALNLLGLLKPILSLEDVHQLLSSPFIAGWAQEASARALLDGRLRETGELQVSIKTLRYHASQSGKPYSCPMLVEKLCAREKAERNGPSRNRPGQWTERFSQLLKALGWACGRPLSSEEYQAVEAWRTLLHTFSTLEAVTGSMSASTALRGLRRLAGERMFQPKTGAAPVQVLGMLEAGGLQFDHLWVMGLHDGIWPAPPRPNPFIPSPLQRKVGLPHASEERELNVARTITRRILSSADEVIISFPQGSGDEGLQPSPLIADLPMVTLEALLLWQGSKWRDEVYESARLTTLEEDPAPPLHKEEVRGGSAVFKLQAACPFRAFAELRLGGQGLGQAEIGLDAMTRGSLMHHVLEKVWDALASHEQLFMMETTALKALVETRVTEVIDEHANKHPQTLSGRFRQMETCRLSSQVLEWLELEKQRVPFRVVEKEVKYQVAAGGLRVQLKVDRIDELADGRKVLMDYKTGQVTPSQWFGERPEEPQLPLYSMAVGTEIAALAFAQVRTGDMTFKGVADGEGLIPGLPSYAKLRQTREANAWSEVLGDWQITMNRLGEDFRQGKASVDPKQYPATCTYCELQALCRVHELQTLQGESSVSETRND